MSSRWIWIFWNGAAEESVAMAARGCRRWERGQREREGPVVVLERKAEAARRSRCAVAIPFLIPTPGLVCECVRYSPQARTAPNLGLVP